MDDFVSPEQLAERWDIAVSVVKEAIEDGTLPARDIGRKALIWLPDAVEWVKSHRTKEPKRKKRA